MDTSLIITSDRPSTLAFVQLVDGQATYSFFDENSAGRMLTPDALPTLPPEVSALFFGGISLVCEPGAETYVALLERDGHDRAVMIDPNIRPGFIRDAARYRARLARMMQQADIVKLSDEDLAWLLPAPLSRREKVETIQDMGPSVVILTCGREGASGYLADGTEVHVAATPVEVTDTVGAGDTFNAGLLAMLSELGQLHKAKLPFLSPAQLQEALEHAARAAAVTVSRAGANPPWAAEM